MLHGDLTTWWTYTRAHYLSYLLHGDQLHGKLPLHCDLSKLLPKWVAKWLTKWPEQLELRGELLSDFLSDQSSH